MKNLYYVFIFLFFVINICNAKELTIDIDTFDSKKISILFEKFNFTNALNNELDFVDKILNKIESNLNTTNLFLIKKSTDTIYEKIDKNISSTDLNSLVVNKYLKDSYDAVLGGYFEKNSKGQIELRIRFWDILDQRELFSKTYIINETNWKRTADILSDMIFENLTGEVSGHFDSKILFVSETGKAKNRKRKITMMDFDGSNIQNITNGDNMVLTPIFSKIQKNEILYLEYKDKKPNIYKLNLLTKEKKLIGNVGEMSYAPNFNPNGTNEIVFSATKNGYSNIYKINFDDGVIKQLTDDKAISTVPSWSPDGEKIVYVSDKTGIRKLYIMSKDGENIEQISKGRGVYDKPSWSPDGRLISFVKMEGGNFSVGLMTPNGENERNITNAYLVEGVKWSPNGRYLIYSKQNGAFGRSSIPSIYTMDILTGVEHRLPTPKNQGAIDPDWIKK